MVNKILTFHIYLMIRLIILQKERETEIESAMQVITIYEYGNRKILCCVYLVFCTPYYTTNLTVGYRYILYITVK